MRPGVKGTFTSTPASFAAFSTAAQPPSTIRSASETFLAEVLLDRLELLPARVLSWAGWLTSQSFCGLRRMRAPLAPPRLSEPRNVDADAQAVETSCGTVRPDARIFAFSAAMSCVADQRMIHGRDRVLPDQRLLRHQRAEVAHARAHVAMGQLEPGAGERVGELVRVLVEAPRDLLVGRVHAQRQVGRQHGRQMLLRRVEGVRDVGLRALRLPLLGAGRALGQLPFVLEQVLEEEVAPLGRRLRPGDFRAAGDGVAADAGHDLLFQPRP